MPRTGLKSQLASVIRHVRTSLRGHDLTLWTAGLTFYSVVAVVPVLLIALRGATTLFGEGIVRDGTLLFARSMSDAHDTEPALSALTNAALSANWPLLLAMLLPASLYGEGLRRGLVAVAGAEVRGTTGWAGRLRFVPVLVASPLLISFPLAFAPQVAPLYEAGGWSAVLGVVLSFHLVLLPLWIAIGLVLAGTGPSALPLRIIAPAAFCLAAVLAGFLHGFLLFLAIPLDWSIPFGGLPFVGDAVALALWLFGLHFILLAGYRIAISVHATTSEHVHSQPSSGRV